ncbi:Mitochondrial distribution and morphology protein 10 [Glutinoglossum americanum]|uniref:Mitochondrial distribution and morphology protein 10 n=1 Tax=Glutinoglossum americanum TaxID=1670608 RepID=A0A9P8I779_9PEZI|nr:Mitochondrial distribution and morphology protein 10 [Glutinoglossum americanum]
MLGFMEYVQSAFLEASHWNQDNSYSSLTATARNLLDFPTPRGLRLNVSSLSTLNLATSYNLGSIGPVDGSLSYLYSSLPLKTTSKSSKIDLCDVVRGYRHLQELRRPDEQWRWEVWRGGRRIDQRDVLLYGRMFLPRSAIEGLYVRRLSPTQQIRVSCVSDARLKNGGTVLALYQRDVGKYSTELLYSTDEALAGVRGLYNFGPDPRKDNPPPNPSAERFYGRFSAGAELYYGAMNKSGGVSTGVRFTTLPAHSGIPLTMTLTINPLMGNLSTTYAVKAGDSLALCSRFDFNVYSYESDLVIGCELWRRRRRMARMATELDRVGDTEAAQGRVGGEEAAGVLKARLGQNGSIGLLWEGRIKELLFCLGPSAMPVTLEERS